MHVAEANLLIQDNQVQTAVIGTTATLETLRLSFNSARSLNTSFPVICLNLEQENFQS